MGLVCVAYCYQDVGALLDHVHVFGSAESAEEVQAGFEGELHQFVLFLIGIIFRGI